MILITSWYLSFPNSRIILNNITPATPNTKGTPTAIELFFISYLKIRPIADTDNNMIIILRIDK
jgi:hypothetical protein